MNGNLLSLIFVLLVLLQSSWAETVYKTVDANGRVTYTNQRPGDDQPSVQHEKVDVRESTRNHTEPVQVGTDWYCGQLKLPAREEYRTDAAFYEQVAYKTEEWVNGVKYHEKNLLYSQKRKAANYHSGASSYETPENLAKAQDWRCAIRWAKQQEEELAQRQSDVESDILREEAKIVELNAVLDRSCGLRPEYSLDRAEKPSVTLDRQSQWDSCVAPYNTLIDQVKNTLEERNDQLSLLHKIKLRFQALDS